MAEAVSNVPVPATPEGGKKPLLGLSFLENLSEMSMLRQIGLLVGLAASVAMGFAVVLWSNPITARCSAAWREWMPIR